MIQYPPYENNYPKEEEEYEEIEIYEKERYDTSELYPSNINFIIPGIPRPLQKQIITNLKTEINHPPICTCNLRDNNLPIGYADATNYHEECPLCRYESRLLTQNRSFNERRMNTSYNERMIRGNEFIEDKNSSMNNIKEDLNNQKYYLYTMDVLERRQIPYDNQSIYIIPYNKKNKTQIKDNIYTSNVICTYQNFDKNLVPHNKAIINQVNSMNNNDDSLPNIMQAQQKQNIQINKNFGNINYNEEENKNENNLKFTHNKINNIKEQNINDIILDTSQKNEDKEQNLNNIDIDINMNKESIIENNINNINGSIKNEKRENEEYHENIAKENENIIKENENIINDENKLKQSECNENMVQENKNENIIK